MNNLRQLNERVLEMNEVDCSRTTAQTAAAPSTAMTPKKKKKTI